MAYVANDEQNQQQGQGAVSPSASGGIQTSPNAGIGGGGANAGAGTAAAGTTPSAGAGGSFGNLTQYVAANQGNANQLADTVIAPINQQFQTLQGQNQSTLSGIQNNVNSGYTPQDSNLLAQEAANPVSFANNAQNVSSFQKQLNDQYTGPKSAESDTGFQNQQAAVNQAISTGNTLTNTPAGQSQLLQNVEQNSNQSVTGLNQAILSNSPDAQSKVSNAYQPFSQLSTQLTNGAGAIDTSIAANTANAQAANSAANQQINDQFNGINTAVNNQLGAANTANTNYVNQYNQLVGDLGNGSVSGAEASELGLTPDQLKQLNNAENMANTSYYETAPNFGEMSAAQTVNLDPFLTQGNVPAVVNANQVATPEQFQQLQALLALNGGNNTSVLDPTAANEAGTYVAPTLNGSFNFGNALAGVNSVAGQEQQAALQQAQGESNAALAKHNASKGGFFGGLANTIGGYLANPLTAVPAEIGVAKKAAQKIGV